MMHAAEHKPTFRTAEEHDIYILGLVCGTLGALKEWAEDPGFLGIEQVEETLETMIADVESAAEFGEYMISYPVNHHGHKPKKIQMGMNCRI